MFNDQRRPYRELAPLTERLAVMALMLAAICLPGRSVLAAEGAPAWPGPPPARASSLATRWHAARRFRGRPPSVPAQNHVVAAAAESTEVMTDKDFDACRRLPSGKRVVQVTLKPETDVGHLVVWISSITCKAFVWSDAIGASRRRITFVSPTLVTPEQAFRLFLDALNSVGLTVEPSGTFFQLIETAKAKTRPIPLYDWDGHRLAANRR